MSVYGQFIAGCPYCSWESEAKRKDLAKHERSVHIVDEHPDAPMQWWRDTENPREVDVE